MKDQHETGIADADFQHVNSVFRRPDQFVAESSGPLNCTHPRLRRMSDELCVIGGSRACRSQDRGVAHPDLEEALVADRLGSRERSRANAATTHTFTCVLSLQFWLESGTM